MQAWKMWVLSLGGEDPLEEGTAAAPGFLPGESHGQRSLAGYSPQCHKGSDVTDATEHIHMQLPYNVVLVSGLQHSDFVCAYTHTHTHLYSYLYI